MSRTDHKIADVEELSAEGSRVIAEIEGREVAVFRVGGDYHAIANYCIHQAGPLCEGELRGRTDRGASEWRYDGEERNVVCPWHGWVFDVTTGLNIQDERYAVPTYDVEVRDGEVFVRL